MRNIFPSFFIFIILLFSGCINAIEDGIDDTPHENTAPTAYDRSIAVFQNTSYIITLKATDPDGDMIQYYITEQPSNGSLDKINISKWRYTPDEDYLGGDGFDFKANDGQADSPDAHVAVTIGLDQYPPSGEDMSFSTDQDNSVEIELNVSDVDGDPLTIEVIEDVKNGASLAGETSASLTYIPNTGYFGIDSFTYYVNDGTFESGPFTVTITVNSTTVQEPPTAFDMPDLETEEDTQLQNIELDMSAPNGETLSGIVTIQPPNGSVTTDGSTFTYTPHSDFHGVDEFYYKASYSIYEEVYTSLTDAKVTINVTSVNDAPVYTGKTHTINENLELYEFNLDGSDADGDDLTYTIDPLTLPSAEEGVLLQPGGETNSLCSFAPAADFTGSITFEYFVSDGSVADPVPVTETIIVKPAGVIFVKEDADGDNDGTSWENAFTSLPDAIDEAEPGDTLWVAGNLFFTYSCDEETETYLTLKQDLTIKGGYSGTWPTTRSLTLFPTVIDGEHLAEHVISLANNVTLDGITIRNGGKSDISDEMTGGCILNESTGVELCDVTIENGNSYSGGGIYAGMNSSMTITDSTISDCDAESHGGGIFVDTNAEVQIQGSSTIRDNSADNLGGGIFNLGVLTVTGSVSIKNNSAVMGGGLYDYSNSSTSLTDTNIKNNEASEYGGGIYNFGYINLDNCTFTLNSAIAGGALFNDATGLPAYVPAVITGCTFGGYDSLEDPEERGNHASEHGGAVYNDRYTAHISDSSFEYNTADEAGGAVYNNNQSNPVISNCDFSYNTASTDLEDKGSGGAIYNYKNSHAQITNACSFDNNQAKMQGGAICCDYFSNPIISSECTFESNTAVDGGALAVIYYSGPSVTSASFSLNTGTGNGGSIFLDNYSSIDLDTVYIANSNSINGGALYAEEGSEVTVIHSTFFDNGSSTQAGGAVYLNESSGNFINNLFTFNDASAGGAVYTVDSTVTGLNCTMSDNTSNRKVEGDEENGYTTTGSYGDSFYFGGASTASMLNMIIWSSSSPYQGEQIVAGGTSSVSVDYSTIVKYDSYSCWPPAGDVVIGADVINVNPRFNGVNSDEYYLWGNYPSPCIDAGDPDTPVDIAEMLGTRASIYKTVTGDPPYEYQLDTFDIDEGYYIDMGYHYPAAEEEE